jgi:gas vesicle structural protein
MSVRHGGQRESIPADRESIPDRGTPAAMNPRLLRWISSPAIGNRSCLVAAQEGRMANIQHSTDGSNLAEVVDRILDRGCVIDAFVRVTLVGIELLAIEARIVIASVDTWLKYAEAVGLTTTFDQVTEIPA